MIWSWLSAAGRLLWPAIGGIPPAGNPAITITLLAGLLAAIVIGTPAAAVYLHVRSQVKAERTACNLEWKADRTSSVLPLVQPRMLRSRRRCISSPGTRKSPRFRPRGLAHSA